jgi:hypothetical protein
MEAIPDESDKLETIRIARRMVRWPAIGLIATGCIALAFVAIGIAGMGSIPQLIQAQCDQIRNDPALNAQQKQDMIDFLTRMKPAITAIIIGSTALYALGAVAVILGGVALKNLGSRGWSKAAAVLSMIPFCVSYGCLLGLPFGIWAFVVMGKPQVQAGFNARRNTPRQRDGFDSDPSPV